MLLERTGAGSLVLGSIFFPLEARNEHYRLLIIYVSDAVTRAWHLVKYTLGNDII